tara:strand:+ start:41 stop:376 length:336 start_codon:yes stop_codon:yes gene_type:complete
MPITWGEAKVSPATLASNTETAGFSWAEFSVAYELYLLRGYHNKYEREEIYSNLFKDKSKKKKVVELIMKVKSDKIKQKVEIPINAKISLSDIDMIIQEVLFKPKVKIYVD